MATILLNRAKTLSRSMVHSHSAPLGVRRHGMLPRSKANSRSLLKAHCNLLSSPYKTAPVLYGPTAMRLYSGRTARKAQRQQTQQQVKEWEDETYRTELTNVRETTQREETQKDTSDRWSQWNQTPSSFHPDTTTEELVSPGVLAHLRKVYTLVGMAAGAAAVGGIGAVAAGVAGGLAVLASIGGIIPLISVYFVNPEKVLLRQNLLLGGAALLGIGAAPLLGAASASAVLMALGGTGAIFAGFSLAALKAPSSSYLKFGGVMTGAIFVLVGALLLSLLGPLIGIPASVLSALHSFQIYGGLAIFSLFIAYDTQAMIDRAAAGNTDHVTDSLNLFIDVWGIFVRLLHIFRDD